MDLISSTPPCWVQLIPNQFLPQKGPRGEGRGPSHLGEKAGANANWFGGLWWPAEPLQGLGSFLLPILIAKYGPFPGPQPSSFFQGWGSSDGKGNQGDSCPRFLCAEIDQRPVM